MESTLQRAGEEWVSNANRIIYAVGASTAEAAIRPSSPT